MVVLTCVGLFAASRLFVIGFFFPLLALLLAVMNLIE